MNHDNIKALRDMVEADINDPLHVRELKNKLFPLIDRLVPTDTMNFIPLPVLPGPVKLSLKEKT